MKTPAGLEARKETLRSTRSSRRTGWKYFSASSTAQMPQVIVSPRDLDFVIAEAAAPLPETNSPTRSSQRLWVLNAPASRMNRETMWKKAVAAIWSARISSCRWNAPQHSNNSKPMP